MKRLFFTGKWPLLKWITSAGKTGKLSILNYHRVHPRIDPINPVEIDAERFTWQMELLSNNFNLFTVGEAAKLLREKKLPERSLVVTFDDGYADNVKIALPILKKFSVKATFFIAAGFLDGGRMWNDTIIETIRNHSSNRIDLSENDLGIYSLETWENRHIAYSSIIKLIKHLPQQRRQEMVDWVASFSSKDDTTELMMNSEQVKTLHQNGMEIGAHTITHPILSSISDDQARYEIDQGRKHLESIIDDSVTVFAYPNGKPEQDYLPKHRDMVFELGFDAAVSTQWGVSTCNTDQYQLRRFTPWDNDPNKFMLRLIKNYYLPND